MNEDSLIDVVPVMDYDTLGQLPPGSTVTALAGCSQYVVAGTSEGCLYQIDLSSDTVRVVPIRTKSAIVSISIEMNADFFTAISGDSGEVLLVSSSGEVKNLKPEIDYSFLPLRSVAIAPIYSSDRRIVVGGSSGDLLVLSQQGYQKVSVSKTQSKGPITAVDWREGILVWIGPEFGVKALNTETGNRVGHLELKSSHGIALTYCGNQQWLVCSGLRVMLLEISTEIVVRLSLELPSSKFTPNSEIGKLITNRNRVIGIGQLDDAEKSLSVISIASGGKGVSHDVVDTVRNDIPVTDSIPCPVGRTWNSIECEYVAGASPYMLVGIGHHVVRARKRSLAANAVYLIDKGMFEEALLLSHAIKDATTKSSIAKRVLTPLIAAKQFKRVVGLLPSLDVDWSEFIDHFISFESGSDLQAALHALVPSIPYAPRDERPLSNLEYGKVIDTLVRNVDLSYLELLDAVRRWPRSCFDSQSLKDRLIDIVPEEFVLEKTDKERFIPSTTAAFPDSQLVPSNKLKTVALLLVLKQLYENLGKLEDALDVMLKLLCYSEVFAALKSGNVLVVNTAARSWFEVNLLTLFQADPVATSSVLIANKSVISVKSVVSELESHPFFFHVFLREMFLESPDSTREYHNQQVALFAQFDKPLLVQFLRQATQYDPVDALAVVRTARGTSKNRELVEAESVLLWKCGKFHEAINLLLNESKDIATAVKFGSTVSDPNLWTSIQNYALTRGGSTLAQYIDALRLVDSPPQGFTASSAVLRADVDKIDTSFSTAAYRAIEAQKQHTRILTASQAILRGDYERMRSESKPWNSAISISASTLCRICGCSLVHLPPGSAEDDCSLLDNAVPGLSNVPFHTKTASVLAVISRRETVHSRCLMRTVVEDNFGS